MKQCAFVTGGTGFIGRALIKRLVENRWRVVALARNKTKTLGVDGVRWVYGDIRSRKWTKEAQGADLFVHCAGAHGHVRLTWKERLSLELEGTKNVVRACKEVKVHHLVYLGTAYTGLGTEYARAKTLDQEYLMKETSKGLPATLVCPVVVYGPGDLSNFHRFFSAIAKRRYLHVGDGKNKIYTIYIDDLIDGIMYVVNNSHKSIGKKIVMGEKQPTTWNNLVKIVSEQLGIQTHVIYLPTPPMAFLGRLFSFLDDFKLPVPFNLDTVKSLTVSPRIDNLWMEDVLGVRPKVALGRGIKETIKWYRQIGIIS